VLVLPPPSGRASNGIPAVNGRLRTGTGPLKMGRDNDTEMEAVELDEASWELEKLGVCAVSQYLKLAGAPVRDVPMALMPAYKWNGHSRFLMIVSNLVWCFSFLQVHTSNSYAIQGRLRGKGQNKVTRRNFSSSHP
jgi:hypothetical protein